MMSCHDAPKLRDKLALPLLRCFCPLFGHRNEKKESLQFLHGRGGKILSRAFFFLIVTLIPFMRAAVFGVRFEGVLEGLCVPEAWCPLCWCKQNFLEEGLSVDVFTEASLG